MMMVKHGEVRVRRSGVRVGRWLPLAILVALLALGFGLGLHERLSLEGLRRSQASLAALVDRNAAVAAAAYILVYVAAVAVSFPGASILTVAGGFMFGAFAGTALALVSATIGATLIFLAARTSLGDLLAERAGLRIQRLRAGFQAEGFSYLLFLRLVPLFPFWLVNLAAALFGMRLGPYVAATALGIVPGTFVFAYFGAGLGTALEHDGPKLPASLVVALLLLGMMALLPVIVRKWRASKDQGA
jgi:uncharacterized membrane protein YdjX (TVP38/TMEM64 family)